MDNFEWRPKARCVAYAEQLFFAIAFPTSVVFALIDANNSSTGVEPTNERDKNIQQIVTNMFDGRDGMLLFILLKEEFYVLLIVVGLWATLKLSRATALRRGNLKEVIQLATVWRNVNLFFLLLLIIDLLLFQTYVWLTIELILAALLLIFLYIVTAYMQEVRTVVNHIPVISHSDTM